MNTAKTTNDRDNGTLKVGANPLGLKKGDKVKIKGEEKVREVTYVQGFVERSNVHIAMKGSGPVPLGEIEYEKVS